MFIKVSMDATLFGVVLNTSFISALQQKEARIGFKNLNELTVFLETWIKDSSEDSQTDFSPKENQMLYQLVVFLHGVSASVSYAIKKERDIKRFSLTYHPLYWGLVFPLRHVHRLHLPT